MPHTYDVIIIGAGIAGSALALSLARQNIRTILLDKSPPPALTEQTGLRVSSIHWGSERYLNSLGVDLDCAERGIFNTIKVWQERSAHELTFASSLLGLPHLGSIIENNVLIDQIHQAAKHTPLTCIWNSKLESVHFTPDAVLLNVEGMPQMSASLIVGADGAHSWLRGQVGISQDERSYEQTAMVAHIHTQKAHGQTAYQRFLNTGPLAYLPLNMPHESSIVWSSTPTHIADLLTCTKEVCAAEIALAMGHRLGDVTLISERAQFPLRMRHAQHYIALRSAFVGDAIHTVHPLAGQGANLGLADVAALAKALSLAHSKGRDLGCISVLRPYERGRRGAHVMMLQAMQWLARNQMPMPTLRGFALQVASHTPILQRGLMRYALGLKMC